MACTPSIDVDLGGILDGEAPTVSVSGVDLEPNVFVALQSGPLVDESLGSCILSDFSLLPQPYLVEGSPYLVEGSPYLVEGSPYLVEGSSDDLQTKLQSVAIAPESLAEQLEPFLSESGLTQDVAILILDDFGNSVFQIAQSLFEAENPSAEMIASFEDEGASSHGAFVMNHINGVMNGLSNYEAVQVSADKVEWRHKDSQRRILVKAAVPSGFETGSVGEVLAQGLADLRAEGFERIVVNMSFVILPCSIVREFLLTKLVYPSLFDYLANLVDSNVERTLNDQGVPRALSNEIARQASKLVVESLRPVDPEGDPLRLAMLANPDVLFVGAAGNFGRNVAAYPAAWDEVLAVSANDAMSKADFSNTGEVMFRGAWFRLTNPLNLNGHDALNSSIVYSGTSFAAPGMSAFLALDWASEGHCFNGNRLAFAARNLKDEAFETAVNTYCNE